MDDSTPLEGFSSLLHLAGYNVPARARFVGETVFTGIFSATTMGLVAGQLGMALTPVGPLIPFMAGSGVGFCLGMYTTWQHSVQRAKTYARHYPHILAHALWTESRILVPADESNNMEYWIQNQGVKHLSMCVLAAQECRGDVEEVEKQERQRLVEVAAAALAAAHNKEDVEE